MKIVRGKILLTGATGFIGRSLWGAFKNSGAEVVSVVRESCFAGADEVVINSLETADLSLALGGVSVVVHCAGLDHIVADKKNKSLDEFRRVNVEGTLNLARQAVKAGVSRFIFISSIKVNGEVASVDKPFCADDVPRPQSEYGRSKMEAENALRQLSECSTMSVVIIRPVLVYGPNPKGNFRKIMNLVAKGVPLPFGAVYNRRSFLFIDNLIDFVVLCISHPRAANETFLLSDGNDVSTRELIEGLAKEVGRSSRLVYVPIFFLNFFASLLGRQEIARSILESQVVDITKNKNLLGWAPPVSFDEGLRASARSTKERL